MRFREPGGEWERIQAQLHVSIFAGNVMSNPCWPDYEGDVFLVENPNSDYRVMKDCERKDLFGRLNRPMQGVEMGIF
jgi:hypothetical protein